LCLSKTPICVRRLELCLFFVFSGDAHFSSDTPCHRVFDPAFARCPGVREPGSPAPNRRSSTLRKKAYQVDSTGPAAVGLALPRMERLALSAGHRSTRNGACLASPRLRSVSIERAEHLARTSRFCENAPPINVFGKLGWFRQSCGSRLRDRRYDDSPQLFESHLARILVFF
jgi:hypothetical protein